MQIVFKRNFLKSLAKLPFEIRQQIESFVFNDLQKCDSIYEVGSIEKMKGYENYYKIRFGSYRVGIKAEKDKTVTIETVMHRKEIYRYFP